MKRRSTTGSVSNRPGRKDGLPPAERAELRRQGAKAAVRGEEGHVNPMDEQSNRPSSTGECPDVWQSRKDAWQEGHDAQSRNDERAEALPPKRNSKDER
ncbi:CrpP-related protein [Roseateles chitosanitabidus]|uniref:CrpP-related protein n=1 Tax=Roseateles chitosanitabidus TaxID=65048 RepID=UPI001471EBBD